MTADCCLKKRSCSNGGLLMSENYANECTNIKGEREGEAVASRKGYFIDADEGYLVEFAGAMVSWFLDKPSIALIALGGKGLLQIYQGYLNRLPDHGRIHHTAVRNTLLGSGLLTALPITTEGTPLMWLIAALLGSLIAWMVLIITGCLRNTCPVEEAYAMREAAVSPSSESRRIPTR